jgi:hypothetical protein
VFRTSFEISPDGRHAACVATDGTGAAWLEGWTLTGSGPRRRLRARPTGDPARWRPRPLAGDRLLVRHEPGGLARLTLFGPGGELASRPDPYRSVAAAPADHGLALGLVETLAGTTEVYLVGADLCPAGRAPVAVVPGRLRGRGVVAGDLVAFPAPATRAGGAAGPVVVDLAAGRADRLPLPPTVRGAVPVHAAGDTLLAGVNVADAHRLALLRPRDAAGFTPLTGLDQLTGSVQPLALDPTGAELVLRVRTGVRSRLLRHRLATGTTSEIAAPAGIADPVAGWSECGLWLPYTTTTAPTSLWWLQPGQARLRRGRVRPPRGGRPGRVATFDGPAGPVEAVVYGDWRRRDSLVVALHGGPAAHWPLAFDAGLQALAAAGLAVVAPNPRGSTGYGRQHEEAITGAWGGRDLADVVAVEPAWPGSGAAAGRHRPCTAPATGRSWRCWRWPRRRGCGPAASRSPPSGPPPGCTPRPARGYAPCWTGSTARPWPAGRARRTWSGGLPGCGAGSCCCTASGTPRSRCGTPGIWWRRWPASPGSPSPITSWPAAATSRSGRACTPRTSPRSSASWAVRSRPSPPTRIGGDTVEFEKEMGLTDLDRDPEALELLPEEGLTGGCSNLVTCRLYSIGTIPLRDPEQ